MCLAAAASSAFYGYKGGVLSPLPTNHSLPQGGAGALGCVGGLSSPAPVRLAASVADAAGGGCEATGTAVDSGSSSKPRSTCGAATHLPNRWLAASKMASAYFW